MTEFIPIVDHASRQGLQWFLILELIVLGVIVVWYVRKSERKIDAAEETIRKMQEKHEDHLKTESLFLRTLVEESNRIIKEFNKNSRRQNGGPSESIYP